MLVALLTLLVLGGALLAVGWVFSNRVLVPEPYGLMPEFRIVAVSGVTEGAPSADGAAAPTVAVTLPAPESGAQHANTLAEGVYGLLWEGGHGLLGSPVAAPEPHSGNEVTRELRLAGGELPRAGAPARLDNFVYRSDPATDLGLEYEELTLEGPVGELRSWFVPAPGGTAVLLLHGRRRGELIELLRYVEAFHQLRLPSLALAYRNHAGSADSPDGYYHYGASEWEDALVGARELKRRGYERVILFGASMGGAVALEALKRWPADAPEVLGLVLDSPLVDPFPVVKLGAEKMGVPLSALMTRLALSIAGARAGVDFGSLRQHASAAAVTVPLLLIAGEADSTVPVSAVDRFAAALSAPLTYVRLPGVEHVEAWNEDPRAYLEWLRRFVSSLQVAA